MSINESISIFAPDNKNNTQKNYRHLLKVQLFWSCHDLLNQSGNFSSKKIFLCTCCVLFMYNLLSCLHYYTVGRKWKNSSKTNHSSEIKALCLTKCFKICPNFGIKVVNPHILFHFLFCAT